MDNPVGLKGGEGCKILSYVPYQMLSFSWNAPPQHKEVRESKYKAWVVVNFKFLSNSQTEVTLTHLGWPDNEKWTAVYDYFNSAWNTVLNELSTSAAK